MVQTRAIQARRIAVVFSSVVGAGTAALLGAGQSSQTANTAPRPRLFTEAQAASGETVYRQSCAACHGATLTGGTAPSLTGPRFETSWGDPRVTLADLFFIMRTTMPPRASNSVSAQDHAAVFAYILQVRRL